MVMGMLVLEQAEGFLRAQLGDSGEIPHTQSIQYLCAGECSCTHAERTFYGVWNDWRGRNDILIHILNIQTTSGFSLGMLAHIYFASESFDPAKISGWFVYLISGDTLGT